MVRYKKLAGIKLNLTSDAKNWLNSFMALWQISERGKKNIIEATESRLFDRASWVSVINDAIIPEYNGSDYLKFDSWIKGVNVQ